MESGLNGILLDENIPPRVALDSTMPVVHCSALGQSPSDTCIWEYARDRGFVIVTKDADFSNRIMLSGPPPWVVHLRIGNMRAKALRMYLAERWPEIGQLLPVHKLINVYADRIEAAR